MNTRWAIAIVTVYLLCVISGILVSIGHRAAIQKMVDEAKGAGEPVIAAVVLPDSPFSANYSLKLVSFRRSPIGLAPRQLPVNESQIFFSDEGDLLYWRPRNDMRSNLSILWSIEFPDFEAHKVEPTTYMPSSYSQGAVDAVAANGRWWIKIELNSATLMDTSTFESSTFEFEDTPWGTMQNPEDFNVLFDFAISNDGKTLIALLGGGSGRTGDGVVWKYDIEKGIWINLTTVQDTCSCSLSPDGSFIGLSSEGARFRTTRDGYILDGSSGALLETIPGGGTLAFGDRWAAYVKVASNNEMSLIVFDMQNNWQQREVDLHSRLPAGLRVFSIVLAIYEPHPN